MARGNSKKKKKRGLNETTHKRISWLSSVLGIVGAVAGIIAIIVALRASAGVPKKPQMQAETLEYSRVQNYAQNFFQVWMMGKPSDRDTLESFYSASPLTDLNADPATISDLNVADLSVAPTKQGEILWTVTLGTTMTPPGVSSASRNYYEVTVLEKDKALTIAKLPRIVDLDRPEIEAGNAYTTRVNSSSPLYQVAVNFAATYLTPQASESFGRYVTADFVGEPLKSSPYSGAQVTEVSIPQGVVLEQIEPGKTANIMVRVRASTSQSSYQTMDIPLTAEKQKNGQWLIASVSGMETVKSQSKEFREPAK